MQAAAEKLKDEATKANRPLKDVFAGLKDLKVVQPPPFLLDDHGRGAGCDGESASAHARNW